MDLDGTLYRISRARVIWRLRRYRGLLLALLAAREKIRHEPPLPNEGALRAREAELVAPSVGLSTSEAAPQLAALRRAIPSALTAGAVPYPGVRMALLAAARRNLKLVLFSDYDPREKLSHLGLDDLPWSLSFGAEELGALKPHPVAFRWLAEQMDVPVEAVLHVGDREDLDVAGALAAGARAWRFAPDGWRPTRAERVFGRWSRDLFLDV
ncbi:MAG: HAD family hydrolase [Deltaproteobacteria bacterium]|nr:HAD family hydrolase [Deltaproteobacteria bacterium]